LSPFASLGGLGPAGVIAGFWTDGFAPGSDWPVAIAVKNRARQLNVKRKRNMSLYSK